MGWKRSFKHPFKKGYRSAKHAGNSIAHATSSATSSVAKTLDTVKDTITGAVEGQIKGIVAEAESHVSREIKQRQLGLVFIGVSICFALLGSILLSFAGVYVLIDVLKLPVWMSYTSVGGLFAIISVALLLLGRRQLDRDQ